MALEYRFDPPRDAGDALRLPFAGCWKEALNTLREFVAVPDADWRLAAEEFNRLC